PNLIFPGDMIIVPDGQPIPRAPAGAGPSSSLAGSVGKLLWPTSAKNITQGYSVSHRGLDIANGGRPPIYAAHDGTVIFSGTDGAWGRTIVIRASNGLSTRYAHNSENYVKTGQKVKRGQTIAKVGNTGNVRGRTGLHLHFSVYKNGIAINPMSVLR
ncbi:MAG TPA: M23 family metallopeptidase, partial [Patescibacteria group bacterium]|nr:M23 family metallopeptidase [Patescibacteria group bacterium]